jgi:hypothetical protein
MKIPALVLLCGMLAFAMWRGVGTAGFDYDELMMVLMGFAAFAAVVVDWRREARLDTYALDFTARLVAIEQSSVNDLGHRLARLEEGRDDRYARLDERVGQLADKVEDVPARLLQLEGGPDERFARLDERVDRALGDAADAGYKAGEAAGRWADLIERFVRLETRLEVAPTLVVSTPEAEPEAETPETPRRKRTPRG